MKKILIDCTKITSPGVLHETLARELCFPEWYGNNLDALADCLSEICEETELVLLHWQALDDRLGDYAGKAVFVCHSISEENPNLRVTLAN